MMYGVVVSDSNKCFSFAQSFLQPLSCKTAGVWENAGQTAFEKATHWKCMDFSALHALAA